MSATDSKGKVLKTTTLKVTQSKSKDTYGSYMNWTLKASQVGLYKNKWNGEFSDLIWKGTAENGNLVVTSLEGERYNGETNRTDSFYYRPDPQDEILISAYF